MPKYFQILVLIIAFNACQNTDDSDIIPETTPLPFISAVDISSYPEIALTKPKFYNADNIESDFLNILQENGINTIRLRLWVNPPTMHSGFFEVKKFCKTLRTKGFKIWLSVHYSNKWADPGQQETPQQWQELSFDALKDSVFQYTTRVVKQIEPNYIQIGNEINSGILHPFGHISNISALKGIIAAGIAAVREHASQTEIIIHFAGIDGSEWFYEQISMLDYDIMGISYYPFWHGKSLENLKMQMQNLSEKNNKPIVIAETAYPFTLNWNDWTNNIMGTDDALILPEYAATVEGQRKFIADIITILKEIDKGKGFCYWGAELISWKGKEAQNASAWENQALFDFNNKALPVLNEFKISK